MNTRERFVKVLTGEEVDRVPYIPLFGDGYHTVPQWEKDHPGIKKTIREICCSCQYYSSNTGISEVCITIALGNL